MYASLNKAISDHTYTRHVSELFPEWKFRSKITRRPYNGQTEDKILAEAEEDVRAWLEWDYRTGHPPHQVRKADDPGHVAITIRRPETGSATYQTPEGQKTFVQRQYTIIAHEETGIIKIIYPSGPGFTTDGLYNIGVCKFLSFFLLQYFFCKNFFNSPSNKYVLN